MTTTRLLFSFSICGGRVVCGVLKWTVLLSCYLSVIRCLCPLNDCLHYLLWLISNAMYWFWTQLTIENKHLKLPSLYYMYVYVGPRLTKGLLWTVASSISTSLRTLQFDPFPKASRECAFVVTWRAGGVDFPTQAQVANLPGDTFTQLFKVN